MLHTQNVMMFASIFVASGSHGHHWGGDHMLDVLYGFDSARRRSFCSWRCPLANGCPRLFGRWRWLGKLYLFGFIAAQMSYARMIIGQDLEKARSFGSGGEMSKKNPQIKKINITLNFWCSKNSSKNVELLFTRV